MTNSVAGATDAPRPVELFAVLLAGTVHVATELLVSETAAFIWSGAVAVGFGAYFIGRALRTKGLAAAWGFRRRDLFTALPPHLGFAILGSLGLGAWAMANGGLDVPRTFWLTAALYPFWGVAQQFALQILIARNLEGFTPQPLALAALGALLFGASHVPRFDLALLTLAGGIPFILLFRRFPNLWAVGLAHGWLGTCAAYLVLRHDPGATILAWVR